MEKFLAKAALVALILIPGVADAGSAMKLAGDAFAPPAFYVFCSHEASLCRTGGGTERVVLASGRPVNSAESMSRSIPASRSVATVGMSARTTTGAYRPGTEIVRTLPLPRSANC